MKILLGIICCGGIALLSADETEVVDLSLERAEQIAFEKNRSILLYGEQVEQNRQQRLQGISAWLPSITLQSIYTRLEKPLNLRIHERTRNFPLNQLQLSQPIFSPELLYQLKASKLGLSLSKINRESTVNDTMLQVRSSYYNVVFKQISLQVQKQLIDYLSASLTDEQTRWETGRATNFEVNQSKIALNTALSAYHTRLAELKEARNQLVLTLGVDPKWENQLEVKETRFPIEAIPELAEKLQTIQTKELPSTQQLIQSAQTLSNRKQLSLYSENDVQKWVEIAKSKRPSIKQTHMVIDLAAAQLQNRRNTYFPTVTAFVNYGYFYPIQGQLFKQQYNFSGGLQLNWTLFDSFKREFAVKEMRYVKRSAELQYRKEIEATEVKVRNQIWHIEEAMYSYASADEAYLLAKQGMEEAKVRLEAGTITPLQYRDAALAYVQSHQNSELAKFRLLDSYFQLCHEAGLDTEQKSSLLRNMR